MSVYRARVGRLLRLVSAATILASLADQLEAQNAVYTGRVTAAGAPIGGASVGIPELMLSVVTSADGRYTLTVDVANVRGRTVNVVARAIGFKPTQRLVVIEVGRVAADFELVQDVLNLEQIVVTGVSDATTVKMLPFAVTVVDVSLLKSAPGTSPIASLSGKVAGASVITVSGQPGAAPAIRLRAPVSISGGSDPLFIVDGTITRHSLADIASEDIERIEVIKGAAASSLYGSDAANGVVQIFTRRGASLAEGETSVSFRSEYGRNSQPRRVPRNESHSYKLTSGGDFERDAAGNRIPEADGISDNPYPQTYDQLSQVFKPGQFMTNYLSVGQRRGATNFNASFQNTQETGVLAILSGFSRQSLRMNLDQSLSGTWDFSVGAFYGRSLADQGEDTGVFGGLHGLEPNVNLQAKNKDGTPYNAAIRQPPQTGSVFNPLYDLSQRQISQGRDRFTGNLVVRYQPVSWLSAESNFNYDVSNQNYKDLRPLGFLNSSGVPDKGALFQQTRSDRAYNTGLTLTAVRRWAWLSNTTRAAWVYEDQENANLQVSASALTVARVTEFSAASRDPNTPIFPGSRTETRRARNAFLVSTLELKDRYILDGLVRRDESSLFGSKERGQTYHRLSGAYRVSQDLEIPGIDELKLRASIGTAGLRPSYDAQYETYELTAGSPAKVRLGNPSLKPAFSREVEYGLNAGFLKKFTLEYSYSNKLTKDQILDVPLSLVTGYSSQWRNAGTLQGDSHEIALGALLFATTTYSWKLNVVGDRTRSRIVDLNVQPFLSGPPGSTKYFRVAKGETFGVIYGQRFIRTASQLARSIASGTLAGVATDYVRNEDGFYVAAATKGTLGERPLVDYPTTGSANQQIGDVNPDFNLSLNNSVQWRHLSVHALVNWVQGGNIYNLTRQSTFAGLRNVVVDQRGKPQAARKPTSYYASFFNLGVPTDYFVEDGSYIRLRELSANVQLPKRWTRRFLANKSRTARFGIVGRNLWTATKYSGYDPDVTAKGGASGGGDQPFSYRVDGATHYPSYRTLTLVIDIGN